MKIKGWGKRLVNRDSHGNTMEQLHPVEDQRCSVSGNNYNNRMKYIQAVKHQRGRQHSQSMAKIREHNRAHTSCRRLEDGGQQPRIVIITWSIYVLWKTSDVARWSTGAMIIEIWQGSQAISIGVRRVSGTGHTYTTKNVQTVNH